MPQKSRSTTASDESAPSLEHPALPTLRVASADQEPGFLHRLQQHHAVQPVAEGWSGDIESLPPGIDWVLYPNGDLERIRI